MYTPSAFQETRQALLFRLMREHPFGLVITVAGGEPCISHVPFHVDAESQTVCWHLAVQNPQSTQLLAGVAVTLVFQGPHAYVSPRWYEKPGVPTWNYLAVHVSGAPEAMAADETGALVKAMTRIYEGEKGLGEFEQASSYANMQQAITGFRLRARSLQGKFKLSQNRSRLDQESVARQLLASTRPADVEVGKIMQELLAVASSNRPA